jgi:hypothetical protein
MMNSKYLLAICGLAIGACTAISAAPAGAVALNTGGVTISDGAVDFYAAGTPASYSVTFNPTPGIAFSSNVSGSYVPFFPNFGTLPVATSTGTFNRVGATENYSLASTLNFSFSGGSTIIAIDGGNIFTRSISATGIDFSGTNLTGRVINNVTTTDNLALPTVALTFNDLATPGGGGYTLSVSPTAVPEPFTIIGTLVGGTAALRMRKKLIATVSK